MEITFRHSATDAPPAESHTKTSGLVVLALEDGFRVVVDVGAPNEMLHNMMVAEMIAALILSGEKHGITQADLSAARERVKTGTDVDATPPAARIGAEFPAPRLH